MNKLTSHSCAVICIILTSLVLIPFAKADWSLEVTASADVTSGPAPLTVHLSAVANGGKPPYTFGWDFSDGSPSSSEQNPTHTFTSAVSGGGGYIPTVTVWDSEGAYYSAGVPIIVTTSTTPPTENPNTTTPTTGTATLTDIKGNVEVERNGVTITTSQLQSGDKVTTGQGSSAIVTFDDGSKVEIAPNSSFELGSLGANQSVIQLLLGKIHALLSNKFQIRTPLAVMTIRGTEFVLEVTENGTTTLTVLSDAVEFSDTGSKKTVFVEPNQTSSVTLGGEPSDPVPINPSNIDRWWEGEETAQPSLPLGVIYGIAAAVATVAIVAVVLVLRKSKKGKN